jgi:hypothetical protein
MGLMNECICFWLNVSVFVCAVVLLVAVATLCCNVATNGGWFGLVGWLSVLTVLTEFYQKIEAFKIARYFLFLVVTS